MGKPQKYTLSKALSEMKFYFSMKVFLKIVYCVLLTHLELDLRISSLAGTGTTIAVAAPMVELWKVVA